MISYIILHFLQEYKAFLIIFSKKNFHESFILLQKLKKNYQQNSQKVTNFKLKNGLDTSWGKVCNITTVRSRFKRVPK